MLNSLFEWMKKCLKHAKILYFCIVIAAFVLVRGVFPFWLQQVGGRVEKISVSMTPSVTSSVLYTTQWFSSRFTASDQMPIPPNTTSFATAPTHAHSIEQRKAFGNSHGLGYTIKEFNQLTEQELLAFHGVGKVTARAIVELRNARGGFRTFDELLDVRGIGPAKLKKILGERDETN